MTIQLFKMVNNYISNDDEESNKRIPLIVSILLCLLSIIPIIILLVTQLKYKKKKIKETDLLKNFDYMNLEDE